MTLARSWVLMLQRNFPEALAVAEKFPGEILMIETTAPCRRLCWKASFIRFKAISRRRSIELEHARMVSDNLLREAPEDAARHAQHGLILAALGRKQEAIAEGKRAVELLPESQDAFDGPKITASLAQIYGLTGESDEAFRLLTTYCRYPMA